MKSLKVNDKVMIIAGDNKGKEAAITAIDRKAGKAQLEGIEVRERHYAKSFARPQGGKATVQGWIDLSNLKLIESKKVEKTDKKAKKGAK